MHHTDGLLIYHHGQYLTFLNYLQQLIRFFSIWPLSIVSGTFILTALRTRRLRTDKPSRFKYSV